MSRKILTFTVDTKDDRDLLKWLDEQDNRSLAIREAIRAQLYQGNITVVDVLDAVQKLERKITNGVVVAGAAEHTELEEPAEAAAALDALANL